jgi:hypothetical protein
MRIQDELFSCYEGETRIAFGLRRVWYTHYVVLSIFCGPTRTAFVSCNSVLFILIYLKGMCPDTGLIKISEWQTCKWRLSGGTSANNANTHQTITGREGTLFSTGNCNTKSYFLVLSSGTKYLNLFQQIKIVNENAR